MIVYFASTLPWAGAGKGWFENPANSDQLHRPECPLQQSILISYNHPEVCDILTLGMLNLLLLIGEMNCTHLTL